MIYGLDENLNHSKRIAYGLDWGFWRIIIAAEANGGLDIWLKAKRLFESVGETLFLLSTDQLTEVVNESSSSLGWHPKYLAKEVKTAGL